MRDLLLKNAKIIKTFKITLSSYFLLRLNFLSKKL